MGKEYTEINERIRSWPARQHLFFVATAPLAGDGLVNCSPKGGELRVLEPHRLARHALETHMLDASGFPLF